jgi:ketosteroid isomerase-like protein
MTTVASPGARFVQALAAKDTPGLLAVLAPDVSFRGLTPRRFWEAGSAQDAVRDVIYQWFKPFDVVERVEAVEEGTVLHGGKVADRRRVSYRLRVRNPQGLFLVEQVAYLDEDADGRIRWMHVLCAGYQPVPAEA